ncbi:MAG TPA: bifunctional diaminohydroxyphosphoribosylaminopyrimidine deaminase/5-amino-6-(5-phosphoribosylamino)uracil reductase RibD [Mycobacteriales bacterium]|nr:bifunctional diaminohydroxyphosphoribosylaminopyrimidine deaminase/5-amino-6-(5-phosphoribosylamino)uracil reductase RibD [Mycobacteriales bacterium]
MATEAETAAMRRAIDLAEAALGIPNPNPAVGAVVLDRDGQVVGEGATAPIGGPHAEVIALAAAGGAARGGTLVVSLEPCNHQGRTGPCTEAILAAGVARVVYGVDDPHDDAAGGAARLRSASLDVESGVLADEARAGLEPWLVATADRRPYVTWKYAATLDGRTAAADGTSQWITGEGARLDVQLLRAAADAVIVGIGTVLADDPALTVRVVDIPRRPLRVVVDTDARTPAGSQVLDDSAPTLVAVAAGAARDRVAALRETGAEVVELPRASGGVDLPALLAALYDRECYQLLLEGGARLATGFLAGGLVDRVVAYLAPALLGSGSPVVGDFGVPSIDGALRLTPKGMTDMNPDVRIIATVERAK